MRRIGNPLCSQLMEQGKVIKTRLVDTASSSQTKLPLKRTLRRTALFEDIGKGPERQHIYVAITCADGLGQRRPHIWCVAQLVPAWYIPLRPQQRKMWCRRRIDLPSHLCYRRTCAVFLDDVLVAQRLVLSQQSLDRLIVIAMRTHEVNRYMILCSIVEELRYPRRRCGCRSTNAQARRYRFQCTRRVRIQVEVGLHTGNTTPEVDIRLVPYFEVPLRNLINPKVVNEILCERTDQIIPSLHALRRRDILLVPEGMQVIRIERQLLRHEADLNNRPHTLRNQALVDLIDIGEVINRIAMVILVVHAKLIMQDRVESQVLQISDLSHRGQVVLRRRA